LKKILNYENYEESSREKYLPKTN